jgi:4'-phosphopantetheinyl transferase
VVPEGVIELWRLDGVAGAVGRRERRAFLRWILARHLDADPGELTFAYGTHGKPRLSGAAGAGLEFNCADSGDVAVVAVTSGGPVGLDVERIDPRRPVERLARRWFAPAESAALEALGFEERTAGFHRCWAAKEACVKGIGRGLGFGLARFSIPTAACRDGEHAVEDPSGHLDGWVVRTFDEDGAVAAVAAPDREWRVVRV